MNDISFVERAKLRVKNAPANEMIQMRAKDLKLILMAHDTWQERAVNKTIDEVFNEKICR